MGNKIKGSAIDFLLGYPFCLNRNFYPKYIPKNCATDASIMNMCHIEWKYLRFLA